MNRPVDFALFAIFLFAGACSLRGQGINPRNPPPPPPAAPSDAPATPDSSATHPAAPPPAVKKPIDPTVPPPPPTEEDDSSETPAPAASGEPAFDPLHAQRSLEVGRFYLNKGVYDAAIDRFIEASNYQPSLAMPWRLLGEAYEKKHEYSKAIEAYNKYLDILPRAADAAKIKKTVSELEEKSAPDSSKKAEP